VQRGSASGVVTTDTVVSRAADCSVVATRRGEEPEGSEERTASTVAATSTAITPAAINDVSRLGAIAWSTRATFRKVPSAPRPPNASGPVASGAASVAAMEWSESFYAWRRGEGCPICGEGRPDENDFGIRIFASDVADAYLQRDGRQRGYTVASWRGRHVAEPTELTADEADQYWLEVLQVGRAIEAAFGPVKMNYETLGTQSRTFTPT
jgi:hypothetical protein